MNQISEAIATHPDLSELLVRAGKDFATFTPDERIRCILLLLLRFRPAQVRSCPARFRSIEKDLTEGFERSLTSVYASGGGAEMVAIGKTGIQSRFCQVR